MLRLSCRVVRWIELSTAVVIMSVAAVAQQNQPQNIGVAPVALTSESYVFDTAEQHKIRVVIVTKGLSHPWSLAFLPDGAILVTERAGRLRLVRNGVLDPQPISGVPKVHAQRLAGLLDVALHPRFSENKFVYLSYNQSNAKGVTTALARAT